MDEARIIANLLRRAGLRVEERVMRTKNLAGEVITETVVSGYKEGRYKITWSKLSDGRTLVRVTIHLEDIEAAREVAETLEDLGANVDVLEDRVHAVFKLRGPGYKQIIDSIDVAENATKER